MKDVSVKKATEATSLTDRASDIDEVQSGQYSFPYHYIPSAAGFPKFARHWGFSASYIAAIELTAQWLTSLNAEAGHKHMDYGCGDGGFVNALVQNKNLKHISFEGIDFDAYAVSWAEMFAKRPGKFRSLDIATLPEAAYDSGTLIEVFEHIPPREGAGFIAALGKSLKPSAPLFVTVPSTEKKIIDKHYRHFDFETLTECFAEDFQVSRCFGFEKRSPLMHVANRLMRNSRIYIEINSLSRREINQLAQKHDTLAGCGRIGMLLRKKK